MPTLSPDQARELLRKILNQVWQDERQPIVGARLKAALLRAAAEAGGEFSERAIGYTGFTDFVAKSGLAAVKFRPGTDALIAPIDAADVLTASEPQRRNRIRSDFWDAFVSFLLPGEVRGYDPELDQIIRTTGSLPAGVKPITPITRETQVRWREEFIDSLGSESNPLASLKSQLASPGALGLFSRALSTTPGLRNRWSEFLADRVRRAIEEWAKELGLTDVPIDTGERRGADETATRARLYALLDQVPIERLLELRIPLGWLIDRR